MDLKAFMFERYLPEKKKPEMGARTLRKATDEVKRLASTIGRVPPHEIGPKHAEAHKSARLRLRKSRVTINQDLFCLGAIAGWSFRNWRDAPKPAESQYLNRHAGEAAPP